MGRSRKISLKEALSWRKFTNTLQSKPSYRATKKRHKWWRQLQSKTVVFPITVLPDQTTT